MVSSDGTVILHFGALEGGTKATVYFGCLKKGRPCRLVDGDAIAVDRANEILSLFMARKSIRVLDVAGSRASSSKACGYAHAVVEGLLRRWRR